MNTLQKIVEFFKVFFMLSAFIALGLFFLILFGCSSGDEQPSHVRYRNGVAQVVEVDTSIVAPGTAILIRPKE